MGLYNRQYEDRVSWENSPSVSTPLEAELLNQMDEGLQKIDAEAERVVDILKAMIDAGGGGGIDTVDDILIGEFVFVE